MVDDLLDLEFCRNIGASGCLYITLLLLISGTISFSGDHSNRLDFRRCVGIR